MANVKFKDAMRRSGAPEPDDATAPPLSERSTPKKFYAPKEATAAANAAKKARMEAGYLKYKGRRGR